MGGAFGLIIRVKKERQKANSHKDDLKATENKPIGIQNNQHRTVHTIESVRCFSMCNSTTICRIFLDCALLSNMVNYIYDIN